MHWEQSVRVWLYPGALFCMLVDHTGFSLATGLLLFSLEGIDFVRHAGRSIDLRVLLRMHALLFMWIAPALSYACAGASWYEGYQMAVDPGIYFALVIPGTVAFNLALSVPVGAERIPESAFQPFWGFFLLCLGLITQQVSPHLDIPAGLRHPIYLTGQLWLVGLLMLRQHYPQQRWWLLAGGVLYLWYGALQSTLFGYAIIWSVILLCYTLKVGEIKVKWRFTAAVGLAVAVLFLLSYKYEYRQIIWHENPQESKWEIFLKLTAQRLLHPAELFRPEVIQHYTDRLNQGYHTSQAMAYVPAQTPFARGSTLKDDVYAAILPRFLSPDKHRAGGADNIRRFSGITNQPWSTNIGHYGEAYVNFGLEGAWLVLLLYGLLISGVYLGMRHYFSLPWWVFVLEPVLNVEQDIGMGLNQLSKSILFVALLVWGIRLLGKISPWR